MSPEILGLVLLGCLLFALFVGFPIAFTLIFLGLFFGYLGFGQVVFSLLTFQFYGTMMEQTLAAVPLFVFMGLLMEQAGLIERLFEAIRKMLSRVRGALYLAVLFVSTIFAAATGVVGASVTLLGIMAAKVMGRSNYDVRMSAGTIAAGGTLGILIPPSILLIVMGPVLQVPVTDLFAGAIIPGIMLAVIYAAYTTIRCWLNPALGPVLPAEERATNLLEVGKEFILGLVPPAVLVFAALGSIIFGIATPTEGAACGALGALVLTIAYRRLTWAKLTNALLRTLEISVLILFLIAAANFYGAVFSRLGTPSMITELLLGWDISRYVILAIIMAIIFLLGWPLEWPPIILIIVPILIPLIDELAFIPGDPRANMLWFGIVVAVNLQTSWLSPPVALSAYFLKGVVPQWSLTDIYWGMAQFMLLQLLGLVLVIVFPQLILWLPKTIYGY